MKKYFFIFIFSTLSLLTYAKAEDLNPPCPKGKSTWFCYGFKLTNIFDLGSTIGACASENGSIAKNEVAAFAVDFTLKKFDSKTEMKSERIFIRYCKMTIITVSKKELKAKLIIAGVVQLF